MKLITTFLVCLLISLVVMPFSTVEATDLPVGLLNYLYQKDTHVTVRFDGLVTFSNGQQYLPIISQVRNDSANAFEVLRTFPVSRPNQPVMYPDVIQFKNNWFLIRLLKTPSGKITVARLENYPIELKEGILPQDFVMPANLYIPSELKVILGDLPYNPAALSTTSQTPAQSAGRPAVKSEALVQRSHNGTKSVRIKNSVVLESRPGLLPAQLSVPGDYQTSRLLYVANLANQTLSVISPAKDHLEEQVPLNCVPAGILPSPDRKSLYITCTTSNELLVLDTEANLIKTRIPVGSKPGDMAVVPVLRNLTDASGTVKQSQGSKWLTLAPNKNLASISQEASKNYLIAQRIPALKQNMPLYLKYTGNCPLSPQIAPQTHSDTSEEEQASPSTAHQVMVSNRFSNYISLIDGERLTECSRLTLPAPGGALLYSWRFRTLFVADATDPKIYEVDVDVPNIHRILSGLSNISAMTLYVDAERRPYLWMLSRTKNQAGMLDLLSGQPQKLIGVGKKPVGWAVSNSKLYILSALDDRIDVIDMAEQTLLAPIPLPPGTYGTGIVISADGSTAYISSAGTEQVGVVDLKAGIFEKSIPIQVRGIAIGLIGDPHERDSAQGKTEKNHQR